MNKKILPRITILLLLVVGLTVVFSHRITMSKPSSVEKSSKVERILTDDDIVGTWVNHHDKEIHQKITFTANHRWRENQNGFTNIYSGTWKRIDDNKISLAPYNEEIHLYGSKFQTMKVLNYDHILDKESN